MHVKNASTVNFMEWITVDLISKVQENDKWDQSPTCESPPRTGHAPRQVRLTHLAGGGHPVRTTESSLLACHIRSSSSPAPASSIHPDVTRMEKCHRNTRFAPFRDAPFALRGALGSSGSSFTSIDGLRCPSTLEQARGYTSCPLGAVRPKMLPSGCRPLHTSCSLSASVANRPLSPHLPLKKPQLSATFSISHRIVGAALGAAIISIPLATKFNLMFDV
ncbi:hypothetical protein E2562_029537 [Oryza meyeriana var. granulata]|uniref:Succinate dehydrogenase subunit 3 n=1 Tax=Oryza meyeriana var. granulata TaxID=110450 RepID=A0A6G1FDJ5_9ORYZ|nr:hypothetical protein E2562_029537 [Oryza meyeriana var. granulata]